MWPFFAIETPFLYWALREEGTNAEAKEFHHGHSGPGSAGSGFRDPGTAGKRLQQQAEGEERTAPSSQGAREVASRWSWPSAKGGCREGRAEEESSGDVFSPEGQDSPSPPQASARCQPPTGSEKGGLMAKTDEPLTQLATRIPKELHRRLKLYWY